MGKRGPVGQRILYNQVHRIVVTDEFRDLLPFFEQLQTLPRGRRNAALLTAIRGGQTAVQVALETPKESKRASQVIEAFLVD